MIFCVSPDPYCKVHGSSSEEMRKLFHELRDMGIGGVNVTYEDPDRYPGWMDYMQSAANLASEFAFLVSMHAPGGDISSVDEEVRESAVARLGKSIRDVGQFLSDVVVVVHPENAKPDRQPGDDDARKENCRKSLEKLANLAVEHNVRIAIENMRWRADNPNRTGMYTDQLMEIIHGMDPVVGICFDVGHANVSEGKDLNGAFSRNAHKIIHIHLDDNLGIEDDHFQPGEGNIDFRSFFSVVKESGYDGMVQLEVKMKEDDDPMEFYVRNYQYFASMI